MSPYTAADHSEQTWLSGAGVLSVSLIRRHEGAWRQDLSLGAFQAELPWDLILATESELLLDERACSSRLELVSAGVKSAGLINLGDDLRAWVTSARSGWFPSSDVCVALRWFGSSGGAVTTESHPAISDNSAGVAHDLRNQLSLALLRLEMVKSDNMADVDAVRGALRSGRSMCNAFLGADETNADHPLARIIEQEVRGAVDSSLLRKVKVSMRCGAAVLVHAPESALRRFLHNAMMNAIEASPDGSQIIVEVLSAGPGRVELCVDDQGVGLTSAGVASSFTSGASGRGSTGVGTASLRDAANALGSPLLVSTAQGAGSRVSVKISTARADRPVAVLLDSDPIQSIAMRTALEESGWWVIHEGTEDSAVSAVDRLGAQLCVARRGAPGGGVAALRAAAGDLSVPFFEVTNEDLGCGLPSA
jgi:hypothetical protein